FAVGFMIASLLMGMLMVAVMKRGGVESDIVTPEIIGKINSINGEVEKSFLFDTDVDYESGIVKGYMNSLSDPYTVYYTPEEYKELNESMSGTFSGIGVVIQADEQTGLLRIIKAYSNSPAAAAGVKADDLIAKVEGEDIAGMDMNLVVSRIRGEQGTKVNITVYRPSENSYIDFEITRQQIEVETISHKMLDNEIGYIEMDSFDEVTYGQYMAAFNELKSMGMKALIVDIRSNGGGLLSSVCNILDDMLPEGLITYTEDKNGKRDNYSSDANCVLDIPAVVLVNGNSASASEIFTGAMQDYGKAVIVGTQTFGKGIVQTIMGLSDGSAIKMTTSRYYTPKGVCIHGVGITPDIVVEDDSATEEDEQLDKAVEVLLEKIGGR
ncbi:MAG: S41 family peptidase, partial [Lachnospiraceae bacterium]|nr:S41 family peptidase [Lachnospiraceae bacterium]